MLGLFKKSNSDMWLFAGLGNPGGKYAGNRHNIGFMAVEAIAEEYGFPAFKSKFQGLLSEGKIAGQKVALLKPQTFMNESGQGVAKTAKFYKIPPEKIIVFHDELDLKNDTIRIKKSGGIAGHNGLRSIRDHLGTADFWRVRLGIDRPGDKNRVSSYVLSDFSRSEKEGVDRLILALTDHAALLVEGHEDQFMTKVVESLSC